MVPAAPARIRPARFEDLEQIVDLLWDVADEGEWIATEVPFDRQERTERYARLLEAAGSTIFVADASSKDAPNVVGEITVSVAPYGVADISMMLAGEWRGLGLGKALLDVAIAWARETGAHKMWLEVWPHNAAAVSLYQRAGFIEEGRKRRHYRRRNGELWDAVLMGLPLQENGR
jgi:putative acetyltransferase